MFQGCHKGISLVYHLCVKGVSRGESISLKFDIKREKSQSHNLQPFSKVSVSVLTVETEFIKSQSLCKKI